MEASKRVNEELPGNRRKRYALVLLLLGTGLIASGVHQMIS